MAKERDWVDWFEIASRFIFTLAALTVAVMSFRFQRVEQRRVATERESSVAEEVERRHATVRDGRRAYEAQVSTALTPFVIRGSPIERHTALIALVRVAPRLATRLSAVIQETSAIEAERRFAMEIGVEASAREVADDFFEYLGLAREFLTRAVNEHACVEYARAWNRLPERFASQVDYQGVVQGQVTCSAGEYSKGAHELQVAFGKIQTW